MKRNRLSKVTSMKSISIFAVVLVVTVLVAHQAVRLAAAPHSPATVLEPASGSADGIRFFYPRIEGRGRVVQLPMAADQPRNGAKICVDVTRGGDPGEINAAIEKVTRYVNIYAGAGREPADVEITVVLHGDATLCALSPEAYAAQFQTDGNPNIELFRELGAVGVEFRVCGQSLASKGFASESVCGEVDVAVSALTVLVNRQTDGYAYVPLLK